MNDYKTNELKDDQRANNRCRHFFINEKRMIYEQQFTGFYEKSELFFHVLTLVQKYVKLQVRTKMKIRTRWFIL